MYRLQTIMPMYTIAIATPKLIAITNAITPDDILLFLSAGFTSVTVTSDSTLVTLSTTGGSTGLLVVAVSFTVAGFTLGFKLSSGKSMYSMSKTALTLDYLPDNRSKLKHAIFVPVLFVFLTLLASVDVT